MKTYDAEVRQLVSQLKWGQMDSVAYDTSWVARLARLDSDLGKRALEWLCKHQNLDGSWGNAFFPYSHDQIISTLAAIVALASLGRRASDQTRIQRGILALERMASPATAKILSNINLATVGFEMLVPVLLQDAENLGLVLRNTDFILGSLLEMRKGKLEKIRQVKISQYTTLAFSSEMAGLDNIELLDTSNLLASNGSVSNSPGASAYYLNFINPNEQQTWQYLQDAQNEDGGQPTVFPFDNFEQLWALWTLSLFSEWDQATKESFHNLLEDLHQIWEKKKGMSYALHYVINDSDDTAIAYVLLKKAGYEVQIAPLLDFERNEYFACYPLESGDSYSVNVHTLLALNTAGYDLQHPSVQKVIAYLRKKSCPYAVDKWQASAYYSTSHLVLATLDYDLALAEAATDWILRTQRPDGSWGTFMATAEETAYSLIAFCKFQQKIGKLEKSPLQRGRQWLEHHAEAPYPPLWISKGLYSPTNIIRAAIFTALSLSAEL